MSKLAKLRDDTLAPEERMRHEATVGCMTHGGTANTLSVIIGTAAGARRQRQRMLVSALALLATLAIAALSASAAKADDPPEFGVKSFEASVSSTQAAAHGDATTTVVFNSHDEAVYPVPPPWGNAPYVNGGAVKDVVVDLPPGLIGNPQSVPTCTQGQLSVGTCPIDSQIGVASLVLAGRPYIGYFPGTERDNIPIYNMAPARGATATFGFNSVILVHINASVRSDGDYGITADIPNITSSQPPVSSTVTLWGVPAAAVHDPQRSCDGTYASLGCSSGLARKPFMTNPSRCGHPDNATVMARSWADPDHWVGPIAGAQQTMDGCDKLVFKPTLTTHSDTSAAHAPMGLSVDLSVPQATGVNATGTPPLKKAVVTLPAGVAISPASAAGLQSCTDAQVGLHSLGAVACPLASKIGEATLKTPLLADPIDGAIYLGSQESNDPRSGKMFRIFLVLSAPERGLELKLEGAIVPDPATGRVTATFDDNPQLPFSDLSLRFKGGARAPLTNPSSCGNVAAHSVLTAWSTPFTPDAISDSAMVVNQDCDDAGKFTPSIDAGVTNPQAGASSPFVMNISRPDGQQQLGAINASLPAGLLGTLKSVPLCSAARGAAGTCGAESRIGNVRIAAGTGSHPLWLPVAGQPEDSVYLTEPYRKGDVAGMSIVVPAIAGPFNLGRVVTRVFLKLRDKDQGIDLQSDPLPHILAGVPLQIRRIVVTIDRKGFMVNPTNCRTMGIYTNLFTTNWAKAPLTERFQVGGCASLPMSPIITASGGGKGNTKRYQHPSLKVSIRQPAGQAHLSKTNVVLPKELNIDLKAPALKAACPRDLYAKDQCSPVATVGTVKAITPLLREPLEGPAFLIQKKGKLPDLVMRLRNNRMSLDLIGVLDFLKDGRLITRVKGIPDAALSSFVLNIKGGKDGSLLNRSDLCAHRRLVKATFKGQNGKISRKSPVTHIAGCPSKASKSRAASRRSAHRARARVSRALHSSALGSD